MNLCVQPPAEQRELINRLLEGEKICYCAPFDLSPNGEIIKNAFVSVSRSRLAVTGPGIERVYSLKQFERIIFYCQIICLAESAA